jgi:L-alanine-DL-glutamate epimerase-like enolase superfamily enzyme
MDMRIASVDIYELNIPFEDGGERFGLKPPRWDRFDTVLVRVTAENGLIGWGECFSYGCQSAVTAAMREMVVPLLIGQDGSDPARLTRDIQRKLHIFGRYGITIFAISGADIALWDLKAKSEGRPLSELVGPVLRDTVPVYASLNRYGTPEAVEHHAGKAVAEGYRSVKLHEVALSAIQAGRRGAGRETHLTVDANCAWSIEEAERLVPAFEEVDLAWLEEPLFPPEDFRALGKLALRTQVPLAAGENACTAVEFARMVEDEAVSYPQPSVTKVGGVTEFATVLKNAEAAGLTCMPHSPYFGPGFWATLQMLAVAPGEPLLERLYVRATMPGIGTPEPEKGFVTIPKRPGIGFEPDWDVLERFARRT